MTAARRKGARFKRAGVVLKAYTVGLADPARQVVEVLEDHGVEVVVDAPARAIFPGAKSVPVARMDVDLVVTIGGDGTILRTLQSTDAPVFSVNAGIMGFLAETALADATRELKRVLAGDFVVDRRMRIAPRLNGRALPPCLNEVVVHTASVGKMIHFEVTRGSSTIHRVRADGIIVATPTGSTSYNLSVGGPIVDPAVEAFVLSPIAPFTLASRPVVVPATSKLTLKMRDEKAAVVVLDGQRQHAFRRRDRLVVVRAKKDAELIRFSHDFYRRLQEKHAVNA
ncbi:MAG TPA: NAD(+)/NADH kinase [Candidatus Thermoplasmatota archaeon]